MGIELIAERALLFERGGRTKESLHGVSVALDREIVGSRIGRSSTPSDDAFGLWDIDRVQLEPSSNVDHGVGDSVP